jgi:hypothetical protein
MPIPPIQCVWLLQKRIPLGILSISIRMEDPVVVNPETDSKKAFVNPGIACENKKGNVPKKEITSQLKKTITKLSRLLEFFSCFFRVVKNNINPTLPVKSADNNIGLIEPLSYAIQIKMSISINPPSKSRVIPIK